MRDHRAVRCDRIETLTDPDFLGTIVGPVRALRRESMGTPGFSGSTHERLHLDLEDGDEVSLVLKRTNVLADWIARRSGDTRGREAMMLDSAEVSAAWDVFASPYVAYAVGAGEIGLLMHDLEPYLLPDVREPIALAAEEAILVRLARLHAEFWGRRLPQWLVRPERHYEIVGPAAMDRDPPGAVPRPFGDRVAKGWEEAFRMLPPAAATTLRLSPQEQQRRFAHLPRTLVHGDAKVANFAFLPGDRMAAFDWAVAGDAPAGHELGWFLAVNASRLARSKEAVMDRYRALLESERGVSLTPEQWAEMRAAAHLSGAVMLLWSKTLALLEGRDGARAEWEWWVERIPL